MKVFTVHEPPEAGTGQFDGIVLVKEGFCWPALFIPAIWMLWHRMWWVLLAWLAFGVGIGVVGEFFKETGFILGVLSLAVTIWFALEANEFRRWSLRQKGWRTLGVAAGRDREEAEQSYFRRFLAPAPAAGTATAGMAAPGHIPPRTTTRVPTTLRRPSPGSEPVVGLFPHPE